MSDVWEAELGAGFRPSPSSQFLVYAIRSCSTFAAASSWIEGKTCEYRSSVNEMLACPN